MSIINAPMMSLLGSLFNGLGKISDKKKNPKAKQPTVNTTLDPCNQHRAVVICPKSIRTAEAYIKRDAAVARLKLSKYLYSLAKQADPFSEQTLIHLKAYLPLKFIKEIIAFLPKEIQALPKEEQVKFICLVLALIHSESCFKPKLKSERDGAYGLLQVKSDAANEVGVKVSDPEELYNVRKNIVAGQKYFLKLKCFYLNYYKEQGYPLDRIDSLTFAILAYNQGPKKASKTIGKWVAANAEQPITQDYAALKNTYVRKAYAKSILYEKLYSQEIGTLLGD